MSLDGKTALVTGASRGIGQTIARVLADAGARVACVATTIEGLSETLELLGDRGRGFSAKLEDPASVDALVRELGEAGFDIDILVNNAGITRDNLVMRLGQDDFDAVYEVNLRAPFLLAKAFARSMMKKRFGRILNVGSVVGLIGNAGQANYAATKAGIVGLTKSLARELAGRGVTANVVAPGFIETAMTEKIPETNRRELADKIPLGRFGSTQDVAAAVLFLVSPAGAYVTGQVLAVDGGMSM
ncbi:MAG: beta-ketoacyl-ACP reductase [Planctomycetes bacterium]|nr:beta-ketoacyl-ACP reductase [Planctomycetota bacterium]